MNVVELLKAAKARISVRSNWIQRAYEYGDRVCAVGALRRESRLNNCPHLQVPAYRFLSYAAERKFGKPAPENVNDHLGYKATLQMYDEAIADAEAYCASLREEED